MRIPASAYAEKCSGVTEMLEQIKLESIFHPSDFSGASEVAFAHALKIALAAGSKLTILHVDASHSAEWQDFPGVRDTLERWRLIPKGRPKSAVGQLGIEVAKFIRLSKDPVKACVDFLEETSYGSDRVGGSPTRGPHALVRKVRTRADREPLRTNDVLHPTRCGWLCL